jgi:hypothetical protein
MAQIDCYDIYVYRNGASSFEIIATIQNYGIAEEAYQELKIQCENGKYEGVKLLNIEAEQIIKGFWR